MRAIVGCLLMVSGAAWGVQGYLFESGSSWSVWAAAALVGAGVALLMRNRQYMIDLRDDAGCRTCRGAGTVYSAEYNDWRATGPVRTVREMCPSCEGLNP